VVSPSTSGREAVHLVVEEGQDQGVPRDELLGLAVQRVADARIGLDAALVGQLVELGRGDVLAKRAGSRVQHAVEKRVRVGIVGRPPADVEVGVAAVGELQVLGHRLVGGPDAVSELPERLGDLAKDSGELAEENRVDRGGQVHRVARHGRLDRAVRRRGRARRAAASMPPRPSSPRIS